MRPAEVIESDGGKEKVVPPQARPLLALLGFTGFVMFMLLGFRLTSCIFDEFSLTGSVFFFADDKVGGEG